MSIKLKNITKTFENKLILKNFSLETEDKGLYVITGESGAGKTTLLRIIAGLDKSFSGEALLPSEISVCFQEHRLFPNLSLIDNAILIAFNEQTNKNVEKAKQLFNYLGFDESDLYQFPSELSGGMKQRCSLTRALLYEAPVLLLDEPTKELDNELKLKVLELIKNEALARLVLVVSHDEEFKSLNEANIIEIPKIH